MEVKVYFLVGNKKTSFNMTEIVMQYNPLNSWEDLVFLGRFPSNRSVGKTLDSICCCNHAECADFREESWCKRLVVLGILCVDQVGQSPRVSALKSAIKASLTVRSCQNYKFDLVREDGFKVIFRPDFLWNGEKCGL